MTMVEFTDRYQALGIPYPDPGTMCRGKCGGTGVIPIIAGDKRPVFRWLWEEAEAKSKSDDGWHFVECPDCNATGKRP